MSRASPGSLASRTDLKHRLSFFKRNRRETRASSVGEVTIEIENDQHGKKPSKASPLVDYDSGPSQSPSLTLSPTSSPLPGGGTSATPLCTPSGSNPSPRTNQSKSLQSSPKSDDGSDGRGVTSHCSSATPPFPKSLPHSKLEPLVTLAPPPQPLNSVVVTSPSSPCSTPPEVKLRRKKKWDPLQSSLSSSESSCYVVTSSKFGHLRLKEGNNDAGRILKETLERHLRSQNNDDLDGYLSEVFRQLDYHRSGSVSREDFEILCEVLNISSSPPQSHRNSGLEWLPSYRLRPNSPVSPIRVDKLSDVKYKHPRGLKLSSPPPNFLYTIGPRPFWELWPQKKRKKKRLDYEDFKKSLCEQWAKNQGLRLSAILGNQLNRKSLVIAKDLRSPSVKFSSAATTNGSHFRTRPTTENMDQPDRGGSPPHHLDEPRSRRIFSRIRRVARRNHVIRRISQSFANGKPSEVEGHGPPSHQKHGVGVCPVHHYIPSPANGVRGRDDQTERTEVKLRNWNNNGEKNAGSCSHHCTINSKKNAPLNGKSIGQTGFMRHRKVQSLEQQVQRQQEEIHDLKDVVIDLRSSLQLSDAQNLALQVLLKKMSKAEVELPNNEVFRAKMNESEKQLENLVKELKEMSQVKYPTSFLNNNGNATVSPPNSTTANNNLNLVFSQADQHLEDEIDNTSDALNGTKVELEATEQELKNTAVKLKSDEIGKSDENSEQMEVSEAYVALERAQQELNRMRLDLEEAQAQLMVTKAELSDTQEELLLTQCQLSNSEVQLQQTEKRLSQISQNRQSLVLELQTTRELLVSSLNKVQDLELESRKIPDLERRVRSLQREAADHLKRSESTWSNPGSSSVDASSMTSKPAPIYATINKPQKSNNKPKFHLSQLDSGLYSTSESDHETETRTSKGSKKNQCSVSFVVPYSENLSPSQKNQFETIMRLRREVETLKEKFLISQKHWSQERNVLLEELLRRQDYPDLSTDVQVLEAQRVRLTLLEEKIKEVLNMLRSLNKMNISNKTLGKLVLDAVERSVDPLNGEIQVFKFLNHLYNSARDYERMQTENEIHIALRAVEEHSQTLAQMEKGNLGSKDQKMTPHSSSSANSVPTPPRSSSLPPRSLHRIDV